MFRASSSDILAGSPAVRDRFWSKSLKPLTRERKVQMVMEGIIMGMVTLNSRLGPLAPSIWAASITSPGMDWSPAM